MKETIICKLCLEPIFNYICVNCLESSVERWVGNISQELLSEFEKFSQILKNQFETSLGKEKCIKCGEKLETLICPYCYLKEVFDFFFLKDERLARNFIRIFNFDFMKIGHSSEILTKNFLPIIIIDRPSNYDINICETCGNQSEDLKEVNGEYVCEVCRDEIKL